MPEILLRMKIANEHTLAELESIFNDIANKINQDKVIQIPALAAQILYPEIFVKPRDNYMKILLQEILEDFKSNEEYISTESNPYENVLAYMGNIHISPISRIWNTKDDENEKIKPASEGGGRKSRSSAKSQ